MVCVSGMSGGLGLGEVFREYWAYFKASFVTYVITWFMIVFLCDVWGVWVGWASLIVTAIGFNMKFIMLKVYGAIK